jgi:hypothetical protein
MTRDIAWRRNRRVVLPGTELSVAGERGRFRFLAHVVNSDDEWIDCYGGREGREMFRSFPPERVQVVHRVRRMREG